jgi:GntR family transcriptional repressor for pyruvate dehydrogenase complex
MKSSETGKAYEKVIDYIKKKILEGSLKQGEKLPPERDLAEILDVSRNSVREAIRSLEVIGIITSTQGAGNSISCNFEKSLFEAMSMMFLMKKIDYSQLGELRAGLEQQAISLAVNRITNEQMLILDNIIKKATNSNNEIENVVLDKKLHYTIAEASGNQLILEILQVLSNVMDIFISDLRRQILRSDKGKNYLQNAHEQMVICLKNKDRQGACEAMTEHFDLINQNMIENKFIR